jgi:hypothetical protein
MYPNTILPKALPIKPKINTITPKIMGNKNKES